MGMNACKIWNKKKTSIVQEGLSTLNFCLFEQKLCASCQERKSCNLNLHFSFVRCWTTSTWHSFPIPRIQRVQPPFKPIYNLSQNELVVLHEYIDKNFEKGFIQHSKSLASAPIFFVKRKMIFYKCVSIIVDWIESLSNINTFRPWTYGCWTS
jgi:hypothetical protein